MKLLRFGLLPVLALALSANAERRDLSPVIETIRAELEGNTDGYSLSPALEQHDPLPPEAHWRLLQILLENKSISNRLVLDSTAFIPPSSVDELDPIEGERLGATLIRSSRAEIAAEVLEAYLQTTRFDQASSILSGWDAERWSKLAAVTLSVMIEAGEGDRPLEELGNLRSLTEPFDDDSLPDSHRHLWGWLRKALHQSDSPVISEFFTALPEHFYQFPRNEITQ